MQGFIWKPFPVGNLSKCAALTHQSAKGLGNTEWKEFLIHVDIYLTSIVSLSVYYVCSSELVLDNCCFEQCAYCWVLICTAQGEANWDVGDTASGEGEANDLSELSQTPELHLTEGILHDTSKLQFKHKIKPQVVQEPPVIKSQVEHKPAPKGLSDT